jgi:cell division protein FtsL
MQVKENKLDLQAEIRLLKIQLGNLEVQIADYQQIVKELSDKLRLYEEINGTVFRPARK